jgi:tetratricopeptide (TPR) repeat protein
VTNWRTALITGIGVGTLVLFLNKSFRQSVWTIGLVYGVVFALVGAVWAYQYVSLDIRLRVRQWRQPVFWALVLFMITIGFLPADSFKQKPMVLAASFAVCLGVAIIIQQLWLKRLSPDRRLKLNGVFLVLVLIFGVGMLMWAAATLLFNTSSSPSLTGLVFVGLTAVMLGYLYIILGGFILMLLGQPNAALRHYNFVLRWFPRNLNAYTNRASLRSSQEDYPGALADYNQVVRLGPKNANSYIGRSSVYVSLGNYQQAIEDCNQAIHLQPDSPNGYINRSSAYIGMKEYDTGLADCETAFKLKPAALAQAILYINRGAAHFGTGDYAAALADYDSVPQAALMQAQQATLNKLVVSSKAITQYAMGNADAAVDLWRTLIAQNPNYANLDWAQKDLHLKDERLQIAQAIIERL